MTTEVTDPSREYVALTIEKRELEANVKSLNSRLKTMGVRVAEWLIGNKRKRDPVISDSGDEYTVYIKKNVTVKSASGTAPVCEALKECGLGDLVSEGYSSSSLKAYVKGEMEADPARPIPEALMQVIEVSEYFDIGCQKC